MKTQPKYTTTRAPPATRSPLVTKMTTKASTINLQSKDYKNESSYRSTITIIEIFL